MNLTLAIKCSPEEKFLSSAKKAQIEAVEFYLSADILKDIDSVIKLCKSYDLRYALHTPNDGGNLDKVKLLAESINPEIIVCHNIYWEDEWAKITQDFKDIKAKICMENTYSVHESEKFVRRYGISRCIDLEHLQMECCGVYEEAFSSVLKRAAHIHMTGYSYGSKFWHTHIHQSKAHSKYMLTIIKQSGYKGLIVSEAKERLQTYEQFKALKDFFDKWKTAS